MKLFQALRLSVSSCLAFVGAGGKTTALFQLARELPSPVIVTATTHLACKQTKLADAHLIAEKPEDLADLETARRGVMLVTGTLDGDRTTGISQEISDWLRQFCGYHDLPLLIEADGSRQKPLKAPAEHEPVIPPYVETVVVVAGLSALGKPLDEKWVHRVERFRQISQAEIQRVVTVEIVAKVLMHPQGGLKNIPAKARRVALLNQADTAELQAKANKLAEMLLPTYDAVIIACLNPPSTISHPPSAICHPPSTIHAVHEPVAGILLAAGEAKRFGQPKQLLDWRGQPFIRAVAQTALAADLSPVIVVTGALAEKIEAAIQDLPVEIIRNADWQSGQSSSIRAGLADLTHPLPCPPLLSPGRGEKGRVAEGREGLRGVGAAIFLLVDQPQVTPAILRALVERHAQDLAPILAPLVQGQRANPVLFDRVTFPDLLTLTGDVGGRAIFSKHPVAYLPWLDESLLLDIDTPEDYQKLATRNE